MLTYIITTLRVDQWEIFLKDFTSDIDSGYKDAAPIQNDLLYICLFTDFALWRTTLFFLYKHEGKFTPASIMLSFLRISGSNYAYDILNISFLRKFWK